MKNPLHEYLFDLKLAAAIRIKAPTEHEARAELNELLDAAPANLGAFKDGSPILCEVSLATNPSEMALAEVDDKPADATEIYTCSNCAFSTTNAAELNDIDDFHERVAPGEICPAGECPECGALVHVHPLVKGEQ